MNNQRLLIIGGLVIVTVIFFMLCVCCGIAVAMSDTDTATEPGLVVATLAPDEKPAEPEQPAEVAQEPAAEEPTLEPPTATPKPPTPIPTPVYQEPVVLFEYSGVGNTVSDNFTFPACQKAVFDYSVQAGSSGYTSLILNLNKVGEDWVTTIANEYGENPNFTGKMLQPLVGGDYFFTSDNSTGGSWSVGVECHDNVAPVAEGINIQGVGNTVTDNYHLTDCQKSIFVWDTQAGSSVFAPLIASLYLTNDEEMVNETLVNELSDGPMSGEALQAVGDGDFFLTIENTSGPWAIRWECRD